MPLGSAFDATGFISYLMRSVLIDTYRGSGSGDKNWKHDTDQQAHWFDGLVPPTPLISNSPPNPPSRISFWSSKPSCRRNENYLMRYSCRSENAWLCSFHSWPEWHHQRKRGWSKKCSIASKMTVTFIVPLILQHGLDIRSGDPTKRSGNVLGRFLERQVVLVKSLTPSSSKIQMHTTEWIVPLHEQDGSGRRAKRVVEPWNTD